jgi:hypothetical protein
MAMVREVEEMALAAMASLRYTPAKQIDETAIAYQ